MPALPAYLNRPLRGHRTYSLFTITYYLILGGSMIKRLRVWFYEHFLPLWAKNTLLLENEALRRENERLKAENQAFRAYIRGMRRGAAICSYQGRKAGTDGP